MTISAPKRIEFQSVLVKVASRCNLACDYCYVYEHADQSWKAQPHFLSPEDRAALVARIAEYCAERQLSELSVLLHGGEPMLAGAEDLARLADAIRSAIPSVRVEVGMQTNGLLLDEKALRTLEGSDISISLSLDGPAAVHDRHRPTKGGGASHEQVMRAVALLRERPSMFAGVIAVIDPTSDPAAIIRWFADLGIPSLDLLLPDANHETPPPGREADPDLYTGWLLAAFDEWFRNAPQLPIRTFDAILRSVAGMESGTDAFGLGTINMLCIESDGSYHDLDVLKTTYEGRTKLNGHLQTTPFKDMEREPKLLEHASLLTLSGLSEACRACPESTTCAGGSVPHRYSPAGEGAAAWTNPSVYCGELLALFSHAREVLGRQIVSERAASGRDRMPSASNWEDIDIPTGSGQGLAQLHEVWSAAQTVDLREKALEASRRSDPSSRDCFVDLLSAEESTLRSVAVRASTQLLLGLLRDLQAGGLVRDTGGRTVQLEPGDWISISDSLELEPRKGPALHRDDRLLRLPFAEPIVFIDHDDPIVEVHRAGTARALEIVRRYSPPLADELDLICSDVQFIRDVSADPSKSVSFSDDAVPGALFLAPPSSWDLEAEYDVADSLIHEYRHQKLYLIESQITLVDRDWPLVHSPWREEPRPPSGVLHAAFVFVELLVYWRWVATAGPAELSLRANTDIATISGRLRAAFATLEDCALSPSGRSLVSWLTERARL